MKRDEYYVVGGYAQLDYEGLLVQAEYWMAKHDGERDPAEVLKLVEAGLNPRQAARFGLSGATPMQSDVVTAARYRVQTFYTRIGYSIDTAIGELVPYLQYDFYSNPETIDAKDFGGDNEAGLSDDGKFHKTTAGVVYRPIPPVAIKADTSTHTQTFNGKTEVYPEVRLSMSYTWSL
jgi:hypothetical protein